MRSTITTLMDVAGLLLVAWGAWLVYRPAGYIVAGVLLLAASWAASRPVPTAAPGPEGDTA